MPVISIERIALPLSGPPLPNFDLLCAEARAEGYNFLDTLVREWETSANRFDAPGEILLGCLEKTNFDAGDLVAVGGLNRDPFAGLPEIGRLRRVYVRALWRRKGIGALLVTALITQARGHFQCVRLRAENPAAARLYERMGFIRITGPDATHILRFDRPGGRPPGFKPVNR
jgi:GNAT superfamily N-acetyltransferase